MYAIVEIQGQQFKAEEGKKLFVHHMKGAEAGNTVEFDKVLLVENGDAVKVGAPTVDGAKVVCEVVTPLVKGDKVIGAIKEIVPEINIEDLNIPYRAVAADLYTGEEVIFDQGPLFEAIRASISIPSLFRPVKYGFRTLVDGGVVNTMPLDRVVRSGNDIVVAFDVNDVDVESIRKTIIDEARHEEDRVTAEKALNKETRNVLNSIRHNSTLTLMDKFRLAKEQGAKIISHKMHSEELEPELFFEENYYSILSRTFSLMNHVIAKAAAERFQPEVLVKMPFDLYDDISDYAKAAEISEVGRELMKKALDKYEASRETENDN